jgi:hypothetical protein
MVDYEKLLPGCKPSAQDNMIAEMAKHIESTCKGASYCLVGTVDGTEVFQTVNKLYKVKHEP